MQMYITDNKETVSTESNTEHCVMSEKDHILHKQFSLNVNMVTKATSTMIKECYEMNSKCLLCVYM